MDGALELEAPYDYLFKIIIIGESSTGKSTLLHHFVHHQYVAKSHTVGVEFTSRLLLLGPPSPDPASASSFQHFQSSPPPASGNPRSKYLRAPPASAPAAPGTSRRASAVKLSIWDTAGQERFRSLTRSYYRNVAGCLLLYSVVDRSSFDSLPRWLADIRAQAPQALVVVVGNKSDLAQEEGGANSRQVEAEEGRAWAESNGLLFAETSSLTGTNVESPFLQCARGILQLIEQGIANPEESGSGISYGDRHHSGGANPQHRLSFTDVMHGGGRGPFRGRATNPGIIRVKEVLGLRDGKCC